MNTEAPGSMVERYSLVAILTIAFGGVVFLERHPATAPIPTSPPTSEAAAPAAPVALPDRLVGGVTIVPGDKALYYIDTVITATGTHAVPDSAQPTVSSVIKHSVTVRGWAVDEHMIRTAAGVVAVVDGKTTIVAKYGTSRPDVAKAFNNAAYKRSGFEAVIPVRLLQPGKHSFQILILSADRSKYYQAPKTVTIDVVP